MSDNSDAVDLLRLKIERAKQHFEHFKNTILGADRSIAAGQTVGFQYNRERQRVIVKAHDAIKPAAEWGVLLGDVLHQLRATLDHLLYGIASARCALSEKEARVLHFPVSKKLADFNADWRISKGILESLVGPAAFAALQQAQPYNRTDPGRDPLWRLHKLDIIDKHRSVLVFDNRWTVSGSVFGMPGGVPVPFETHKEPVEPGAEFLSVPWPSNRAPPEVQMDDLSKPLLS